MQRIKHILSMGVAVVVALHLMSAPAWAQGLDTPSSDLPPDGAYISPNEFHEYAAMGIILDDPIHRPFAGTALRVPVGNDEHETFDSVFEATEIGQGLGPISLTGPVEVVTTNRLLSTTGTFDTEIVSMSLSGNSLAGFLMIREDPARPSTGSTDITDIGGGLFHIDSFFDVFTELSVDGGNTWIQSDTSTRLHLIPEPGALILLGTGALGLLTRRR